VKRANDLNGLIGSGTSVRVRSTNQPLAIGEVDGVVHLERAHGYTHQGHSTWQIISISTAMSIGSSDIPTADRA